MNILNKKIVFTLATVSMLAMISCLLFSIYTDNIDKSSYTDWISAFCNVVMAGATVAAVMTAKNYLAQFTAQEGYKEAIVLVNNIMPEIALGLNSINQEYKKIGFFFSDIKDTSYIYKDSLDRHLRSLEASTNELSESLLKMHTYLSNISTYGLILDAKRNKNVSITVAFIERNDKLLWEYIEKIKCYLIWLEESTYIHAEGLEGSFAFKGRRVDEVDTQNSDFIDISIITQEMIEESSIALEVFEKVIAEPRHITKIFKV